MKILCVADTKDPLVYSPNVVERYKEVDFVVSCGDLPLSYYEFIISSLNKPFYFVFGNHHTEKLHRYIKPNWVTEMRNYKANWGVGGDFIDGKGIRDPNTGLLLAGLGGSMRYNSGEHQYSNFQMNWRIFKLIPRLLYNRLRYGRYLDILITHAPPYGLGDCDDQCHTGFKGFLYLMRRFKPRYLIHGHVHLHDLNEERSLFYHETEIINVYGSYLIDKESNHDEPR